LPCQRVTKLRFGDAAFHGPVIPTVGLSATLLQSRGPKFALEQTSRMHRANGIKSGNDERVADIAARPSQLRTYLQDFHTKTDD